MDFLHQLDEALKSSVPKSRLYYVDPAFIYMKPDVTDDRPFFYLDGELFIGGEGHSHRDLVVDYARKLLPLLQKYNPAMELRTEEDAWTISSYLDECGLAGRVATKAGQRYAAFWSMKRSPCTDDDLEDCLRQLEADDLINDDTVIAIPGRTALLSDLLGTAQKEVSADEIRKIELSRKLHLMRGAEKKAAMKELGLAQGSKKNAWQKELEKVGLTPGSRWWAMQSESFDDKLARVLDHAATASGLRQSG